MALISSYTIQRSDAVRNHTHPHAHIILPVRKTFFIQFSNRSYDLTPRQIGFIPPCVPHAYSCKGLSLTLNIPAEMVKPADLALLTENCVVDIDDKLELLVSLIKREIQDPQSSKESLRYLFYYLYDTLAERHRMPSLRYMHANYAGPIRIAELAAMDGYNASYYTDWFKRKVGCMPSEYLQALRIEKAKEILATTHYRVLDVGLQVGYTNGSSFIRAFKSVTGLTPHEYRRQAEKEHISRARSEPPRE